MFNSVSRESMKGRTSTRIQPARAHDMVPLIDDDDMVPLEGEEEEKKTDMTMEKISVEKKEEKAAAPVAAASLPAGKKITSIALQRMFKMLVCIVILELFVRRLLISLAVYSRVLLSQENGDDESNVYHLIVTTAVTFLVYCIAVEMNYPLGKFIRHNLPSEEWHSFLRYFNLAAVVMGGIVITRCMHCEDYNIGDR